MEILNPKSAKYFNELLNKFQLDDIYIAKLSEQLAEDIKGNNGCSLIFNQYFHVIALKAYQDGLISLAEFFTLLSVRQLIEDHVHHDLNYAQINTLQKYCIYEGGLASDVALKILEKSLRLNKLRKGFLLDFLNKLKALSVVEQSFYLVKLNEKTT